MTPLFSDPLFFPGASADLWFNVDNILVGSNTAYHIKAGMSIEPRSNIFHQKCLPVSRAWQITSDANKAANDAGYGNIFERKAA